MTTPRDELEQNEPLDSDGGVGAALFGLPVLLVVAGGVVGTTLRVLVTAAVPDAGGLPIDILVVNLVGAFALGLLLEVLALRGPDTGTRRRVRLLVGTGVIGGFTTYSALATDTSLLVDSDRLLAAAAYALGTVVLGAVASIAGILVGRLTRRESSGT
ncbi:CrcB family protein [Herbiconiux sp.]|uniref:fluoride efflux transporter FluC n=1 Tax=Herbiconiux sp. TaxID=1871186 RepID=UPI0025BF7267|nr:CrcB family protein [Herbiconiux sp.]